MADEKEQKEQKDQKEETKLSFKNADELTTFLVDLQGQIGNMQETIDKLSPIEEEGKEEKEVKEGEELTDDEISDIDKLLQTE